MPRPDSKSPSPSSRGDSQDQRLNHKITQLRKMRSQRGYILLILLLAVAILSIFSLKIIEDIRYQYQRDREEELIHRGVQYARAIQHYYRKLGRYPTRIEDLESTNHLRFLRKRYKDPMNRDPATGKERDFKFLHLTDVQTSFNTGPANGLVPVANMPGQVLGQSSPGGINGDTSAAAAVTAEPNAPAQNGQAGDQGDTSQADQQVTGAPPPQPLSQQVGPTGAPQVFGGGAIVGVASLNKKDKTIREFNKKDHYYQWQFVYDPSTNTGGLITTPNQPPLQGANQNLQQQNGPPGTPGQPSTGLNPGVNTPPQQPNQAGPDQQ
jgi:type II secretory pathway pseudopilin PulG